MLRAYGCNLRAGAPQGSRQRTVRRRRSVRRRTARWRYCAGAGGTGGPAAPAGLLLTTDVGHVRLVHQVGVVPAVPQQRVENLVRLVAQLVAPRVDRRDVGEAGHGRVDALVLGHQSVDRMGETWRVL